MIAVVYLDELCIKSSLQTVKYYAVSLIISL